MWKIILQGLVQHLIESQEKKIKKSWKNVNFLHHATTTAPTRALPYINVMPSEARHYAFKKCPMPYSAFKKVALNVHLKNEMPRFLCVHTQGTLKWWNLFYPVQKLAPVRKAA